MERFARRVFAVAGVYGLIVMTPQYFMASKIGHDTPPVITHQEYFYGFIGVVLAWQIAFLAIARDPRRLRPIMLPAVLEKLAFAVPVFVLYAQGRLPGMVLPFGVIDLVLAVLFAVAYGGLRDGAADGAASARRAA